MKNKILSKKLWLLIASGIFIGLLNGFFGGGGGIICVPILEKVLNLDTKHSHATALAVILPLSVLSSGIYMLGFGMDLPTLGWVTLGVVLGGVIGALLLSKLKSGVIRIIFAILMLAGGIRLMI